MISFLKRFWADCNGATAIEYGLIAGILGLGLVFSLSSVGGGLSTLFGSIETQIPD
jgi:pilus assembly protein Flp/PilA